MNNIDKLFVIAAEPSGDALAAEFIQEVRKIKPNITIAGMGGTKMAQENVPSLVPIEGLSILGLIEAIGAWKLAVTKAQQIAQEVIKFNPDVVVLVDSWGFTLRAAHFIRKLNPNIKLIKMVGPQVWATRAGRAKTLANAYDELWCIHDFELKYYEKLQLKSRAIGNPALRQTDIGNKQYFIDKFDLSDNEIIGLLPGSRRREIRRLIPFMMDSAQILLAENSKRRFVIIYQDSFAQFLFESLNQYFGSEDYPKWLVLVNENDHSYGPQNAKHDAFAAMKIAIACSGTVTSEVAIAGVPFIVGYKLDNLTYFIAKNFLIKTKFVTLINVALNEEVAKELLQDDYNVENILKYSKKLLENENLRQTQIKNQYIALEKMGYGKEKAAQNAAKYLFDL